MKATIEKASEIELRLQPNSSARGLTKILNVPVMRIGPAAIATEQINTIHQP
jgi:hypothetical protein